MSDISPAGAVVVGARDHAGPVSPWAALRVRDFRLLFLSTLAVVFGIMGQQVARAWLARQLTGTNTGLGGVMLAFGLSMLVATPWGGVAADRLPKRTVLIGAVAVLGITSLWMGLAVSLDAIAYWMLLVASGLQAAAFAFYLPARIAFISELVDSATVANAIVVSQTSQEGMRVVAPALAGLALGVSWLGAGGVFLVSAGCSAVATIVIARLPPGMPVSKARRSPLGDISDALRYVRRTRGLTLVALTSIGVVMVGFPYLTFLPSVAEDVYDVGPAGFGLMTALVGVGAVAGGILTVGRTAEPHPWRRIELAGLLFGSSLIALGLAGNFAVALVVMPLIGAGGLVFQTTSQALVLTLSDFEYHGRLQSLVILGFSGFGLAALPLGLLADAITIRSTLAVMGGAVIVILGLFTITHRRHARDLAPVSLS